MTLYHAKSLDQLRQLDEHHLAREDSRAIEQIGKIRAQLNTARAQTDPEWAAKAAGALIHWATHRDLVASIRVEQAVEPDRTSKAFRRLYATVNEFLANESPDTIEGVRLAMTNLKEQLSKET